MNNTPLSLITYAVRVRHIGIAAVAYQMRAAGLPLSAALAVLCATC